VDAKKMMTICIIGYVRIAWKIGQKKTKFIYKGACTMKLCPFCEEPMEHDIEEGFNFYDCEQCGYGESVD
jgi:hypothetical protein